MEKYSIDDTNHFSYNPQMLSYETLKTIIGKAQNSTLNKNKAVQPTTFDELRNACRIDNNRFCFDGIVVDENGSIEGVMSAVFNDMSKDPEIGTEALAQHFMEDEGISENDAMDKALKQAAFSEKQGYLTTDSPFNLDLVDTDLEKVNEFHERYSEEYVGSHVSVYIGNMLVFEYDKNNLDKVVADIISDICKWAAVMFDVFAIVSTVAGIWAPKCDAGKINKFTEIIAKLWDKFKTVIDQFKALLDKQSWVDKAKNVVSVLMACLKIGLPIKDMVKAYFKGVKWWKYLLYVGSLVANIIILCISAGASLVAKMAKLITQIVVLIKDVSVALGLMNTHIEMMSDPGDSVKI